MVDSLCGQVWCKTDISQYNIASNKNSFSWNEEALKTGDNNHNEEALQTKSQTVIYTIYDLETVMHDRFIQNCSAHVLYIYVWSLKY